MKMIFVSAFCMALVLATQDTFAWSALGHHVVGELSMEMLSNNVRSKITAILGSNDIRHAAVWPDLLRNPPSSDSEMQQFTNAHPEHATWHYINLPLRTLAYDPTGPFARRNDIIHTINACVDVLEGQSAVMSPRHALRWLVHLVGDLHQPLHVGCGYYTVQPNGKTKLIKNPSEAIGKMHDRGGNRLHYTKNGKLHMYWDGALVDRIDGSGANGNLLNIIRSKIKPSAFKTTGPIRSWAARWALDSVKQAQGAYSGIKFGEADLQQDGDIDSITIIRPSNYGQKQQSRAARQLAKAAFHLAELLNTIQWQ